MNKIHTYLEPVTDAEITLFEEEFNIKLPERYRTFLLNHNGGKPEKVVFDFISRERQNSSVIKEFRGIQKGTRGNLFEFVYIYE